MGYTPPWLMVRRVSASAVDIFTDNGEKVLTLSSTNAPIVDIRGGQTELATGSLRFYGAQTGNFPTLYLGPDKIEFGSFDTNIVLNPQGTGKVKFGTYTAGAATDSTGYITILDIGGNTRKLMVQA